MMDVQTIPAYPDDWRKRWVYFGPNYRVLHRVASVENEDWEADGWIPIGGPGTTVCGYTRRLSMPGLLSPCAVRERRRRSDSVSLPYAHCVPHVLQT